MNRKTITCAFLAVMVTAIFSSCGGRHKQKKYAIDENCVYVCSGPNAKRYHSVEDCMGLRNCSGEILELTVVDAEDYGLTPCRMCVK